MAIAPVVQIQLLEGTGFLNIKKGTVVPVNLTISDIKDLSAKKGGYTKTVTIVGDDESNVTMGHLFDVNIETGNFNRKAKTKVVLLQDATPILTGTLRLLAVTKMSDSNDTWDETVTYEVTITDTAASFFQSLGEDYMDQLDISDYDHLYNTTNVMATIPNTITDGYKYVWPMSSGNSYNLAEFKPAVFAKVYWDKIFSSHGYTYDWASIDDDEVQFSKALIPYNGDVLVLDPEDLTQYKVEADNTSAIEVVHPSTVLGDLNTTSNVPFVVDNEILDVTGSYNPTTGEYTTPFYLAQSTPVTYNLTITYNLTMRNNETVQVWLRRFNEGYPFSLPGGYRFTTYFSLLSSASEIGATSQYTWPQDGVQSTLDNIFPRPPWPTIMGSSDLDLSSHTITKSLTVPGGSTNLAIGQAIRNACRVTAVAYQNGSNVTLPIPKPFWAKSSTGSPSSVSNFNRADVDIVVKITSINMKIDPSAAATSFGVPIRMNKYIPKKIKQRDYLKGLMTLYNLYIVVDPDKANNLIIYRRDSYYDTGTEKNWTKKICLDLPSNIKFAPELVKRRLTLSYAEGKDVINTGYKNNVSEVYGEVTYTFDDENVTGETRTETMFEPSPILKAPFGAYTLAINGSAPKTGLRIVYDGGAKTAASQYTIYDSPTNIGYNGQSYCYTGHFDDPIAPTFDLNFGTCDYYFYNDQTSFTNNTMYNLNWRRTCNQINDGKLLTAKFNLDQIDMLQLELNDKIYIKDSWWNIQEVVDYNAAARQPTTVKLISVDSDIDFAPFKTRPIKVFPPTRNDQLIRQLTADISFSNNLSNGGWNNQFVGMNNYATSESDTNFIVGNDNYVNGSNNLVRGNNLVINGNNVQVDWFNNLLSAEVDYVLDPFTTNVLNIVAAGQDDVLGVGSVTSINIITGGIDKLL